MGVSDKKSEHVYRWVLAYIDENKFSSNQKLPSENALCRRLDVSRETVRSALDRMVREGLIYKVRGSGTYFNKEVALSYEMDTGEVHRKIGLILQGQDSSANSSLIQGIRSVLPGEHVDLRTFLTDNKFSNERRCLQVVMYQNFQGFIIDGVKASILNPNLDCYKELYRRHIPVIFYNNYYKNLRYPRVIVNDLACADQLIGLLIRAGHTQIAGIFVYDNYQSIEKFQGMAAALLKYGVDFQDDYIKWCVSDEAHDVSFTRTIHKFLKGLPKCTAIVCCNYIIYRLVRQALEELGKRVPEDYSLVCFDYSREDWVQEDITCSVHQGYQMGVQVAKRLMRMIDNRDCDDKGYSLVMPPKIYEGGSVKRL
ncbi:GntR family transcriptional regulator [Oscillospiraceae bacterium]|nr:GntR family transcriptional regulator [Oscillospiraceae bacterium]BDF75957.1 GntR family transcriptional regulator [Oscillospiraceae bacterium]